MITTIYLLIGYIYGCLSKKRFEKLSYDEWITYTMIIWPIDGFITLYKKYKNNK